MKRDIFSYRTADGSDRWADPLAIDRRLRKLLGRDPAAVVADFIGDDPQKALAAAHGLAYAACAAFGLGDPFNPNTGEGVLEAVWSAALFAYVEWWEGNGLGASSLRTCSESSPASPQGPPAASSADAGTTPPA